MVAGGDAGNDRPEEGTPAVPLANRTSFHRPADRIAVVLIVLACVAAGVLVGATSDVRATVSETWQAEVLPPPAPTAMPPSLGEAWRAASGATPVPVAVGPTVVTGDGGEVAGRDPLTGQVRWRYARDLPLCTVSWSWSQAIAVYQNVRNLLPGSDPNAAGTCSEVTSLQAVTGERGRQRNGDAEAGARLLSDGVHVTATGKRLLNTWRSDLVLTMQYGTVPAIVQPDKQPRSDNPDKQPRNTCVFDSVSVTNGRIGVIERCPLDPGDRLTVYLPTNDDHDDPEVKFSSVVGTEGARLVALNETLAAVARPDPNRLVVFDDKGGQVAEYPLELPPEDFANAPSAGVESTTRAAGMVFWFTGSRTIALSSADLRPLWIIEGTLGSGTEFAGRMLLPVPDGLAVIDPATGVRQGTLPVNREGYRGPVTMSTLGPMVLEQRGPTLVALR
jgi:hypothetical protein